jgi:hypothetical protein
MIQLLPSDVWAAQGAQEMLASIDSMLELLARP